MMLGSRDLIAFIAVPTMVECLSHNDRCTGYRNYHKDSPKVWLHQQQGKERSQNKDRLDAIWEEALLGAHDQLTGDTAGK